MRDTLTFDTGGQDVIPEVFSALRQHGLPVMRSFDLRTAQTGAAACACHPQSLSLCECQLVVLLVYGHAPEPLTLFVSGCGGQTEIRVAQEASMRLDPHLAHEVLVVLTELGARLNILSTPADPDPS
ncbi:MAG: hypothetical protein JNL73_13985 [Anaerolineales bacterium]|nr:hypothetical protein [Anaerolineales bacterium]